MQSLVLPNQNTQIQIEAESGIVQLKRSDSNQYEVWYCPIKMIRFKSMHSLVLPNQNTRIQIEA